ncbi:MAG: ATP-binding protein [Blastocatellia bacterium]|nr:ATP-binding protein [Blastocatellia bacterium]HMZ81229.1 ATP-binding protein [Acidobacteriota bacterium]
MSQTEHPFTFSAPIPEGPFSHEHIEFTIPSVIDHMHGVLNYLIERTTALGLANASSNLFVALDEAIANAIKHGNKNDPTKQVSIVAELTPSEAIFTITDEGDGFDLKKLPDPTDPDYIMRPCGRGVMLIYHLMDEVRYNTRGNQVIMVKRPE